MSAGRTTMIGGGSGLIALGSLALLARYLEMGGFSALALGQPGGLYHTLTVGTVLSGLILVIFAPPTRRAENRVRLDMPRRETHGATPQARPAAKSPAADTRNGTPAPHAATPPVVAPRPRAVVAPVAVSAAHPNQPVDDAVPDQRENLHTRLDELNRRANEIKVRFGLGKVSPGGYRKFIEELDVERSQIEQRLMEPDT